MVITNPLNNRQFYLRMVFRGDKYGRNDCLTHNESEPMIEVYDYSYAGKLFGPRGQFVSSYYAKTFLEISPWTGLNLHGGTTAWRLSQSNVHEAKQFIRRMCEEFLPPDQMPCPKLVSQDMRTPNGEWFVAICLTCGRVASSIVDGGHALTKLNDLHQEA